MDDLLGFVFFVLILFLILLLLGMPSEKSKANRNCIDGVIVRIYEAQISKPEDTKIETKCMIQIERNCIKRFFDFPDVEVSKEDALRCKAGDVIDVKDGKIVRLVIKNNIK